MSQYPNLFVPSTQFQTDPGDGLWFAFRKREMLLIDRFTLPTAKNLRLFGLEPIRTQFLGHLAGEACYSAELPVSMDAPEGTVFRDLRQLYGKLSEEQMAVAARAVQIMDWDRSHQFCGACGSATVPHATSRSRVCSDPTCRIEHYPRLSPAMIVAVERGPELLMARSPHFPPGMYSVLAGFVDPGESAEEAVHREVFEETRIRVKNVRYFGSQSWPFPHSLMLGFQAEYESGDVLADDDEIEDAGFYHFDALPGVRPGRISIAQWMIHDFCARHGRSLP